MDMAGGGNAADGMVVRASRLLNAFLLSVALLTIVVLAVQWARAIDVYGYWPSEDPGAVIGIVGLADAVLVAAFAAGAEISLRTGGDAWVCTCLAWILAWPLAVLGWVLVAQSVVLAMVPATLIVMGAAVTGFAASRRRLWALHYPTGENAA